MKKSEVYHHCVFYLITLLSHFAHFFTITNKNQ